MKKRFVKVTCDELSHAGKLVIVAHLGRSDHGVTMAGEYIGSDDVVVGRLGADLERAMNGVVDIVDDRDPQDRVRGRIRLRCDLCGIDVPLRQETARALVDGLIANDVYEVRLRDIAANVQSRRASGGTAPG